MTALPVLQERNYPINAELSSRSETAVGNNTVPKRVSVKTAH
jgi:hypothetical protein